MNRDQAICTLSLWLLGSPSLLLHGIVFLQSQGDTLGHLHILVHAVHATVHLGPKGMQERIMLQLCGV